MPASKMRMRAFNTDGKYAGKRMKASIYIMLFLVFLSTADIFSLPDSIAVSFSSHIDTIVVSEENWNYINIPITNISRDNIRRLSFTPIKHGSDTTILHIDSICLIGASDTILVDNFDNYNVTDWVDAISQFNTRFWGSIIAYNCSAIDFAITADDNKCLKLKYYNFCGQEVAAGLYVDFKDDSGLPDYQNWSMYDVLSMKIKNTNPTSIEYRTGFSGGKLITQPNPFNPAAKLTYSIPAQCHVVLSIFDLNGKRVAVLSDRDHAAGTYAVEFIGKNLASGVYIVRLKTGIYCIQNKITLSR